MAGWVIAWYGFTSFLLGLLLFWPLRKLVLALSINRHQRRIRPTLPTRTASGCGNGSRGLPLSLP